MIGVLHLHSLLTGELSWFSFCCFCSEVVSVFIQTQITPCQGWIQLLRDGDVLGSPGALQNHPKRIWDLGLVAGDRAGWAVAMERLFGAVEPKSGSVSTSRFPSGFCVVKQPPRGWIHGFGSVPVGMGHFWAEQHQIPSLHELRGLSSHPWGSLPSFPSPHPELKPWNGLGWAGRDLKAHPDPNPSQAVPVPSPWPWDGRDGSSKLPWAEIPPEVPPGTAWGLILLSCQNFVTWSPPGELVALGTLQGTAGDRQSPEGLGACWELLVGSWNCWGKT